MSTQSYVFAGSGGQGVVTASIILGEAASIHENLNAVQTQVYGPESRGGATRADVVISADPIRFPKVINPGVLICLTQEAYIRYGRIVRPDGLLITDSFHVTLSKLTAARQVVLPMYETVRQEVGNPVVFNVCMLGCVVAMTGIVRPESLLKALKARVPVSQLEINLKAFELGLKLGKQGAGP